MSDLISREMTIDTLYDKASDQEGVDDLIAIIKELPSVTQKSETVTEFADRCRECGARYDKLLRKWIPVSERLPEENETVIASTKHDVYPKARYTKEYGWECIYEPGADYWVELADVTEWMKRNELTLDDSIWSMWPPLSVRARNVLLRAGFRTIGDVLKCSRADLMRVRNMGRKSFEEVEERFSKYGKFNGEG